MPKVKTAQNPASELRSVKKMSAVVERDKSDTPVITHSAKERDVSPGADVPESVKRAVSIMAATEGVTNRTFTLRPLQGIGIPVQEGELRDRRKYAACRDHSRQQSKRIYPNASL